MEHVRIDKNMINYLKDIKQGKKYKYLSNYKETHDILSNVDMSYHHFLPF